MAFPKNIVIELAKGWAIEICHLNADDVVMQIMDTRLDVPMPPVPMSGAEAEKLRIALDPQGDIQ